jgi:hypothetical protein
VVPVTLCDAFFQRNAGACSAPDEEEDVLVGSGDGFGRGVGAGGLEKDTAGCFDEPGDPVLRVDARLAPFFTVEEWFEVEGWCELAGWFAACG